MLKKVKSSRFLDKPGTRKIHKNSVPRFGGIPFVLVSLLFIAALTLLSSEYYWYYLSAIIIFSLGILDDMYTLSWRTKLLVQCGVVALIFKLVAYSIPGFVFFHYPFSLSAFFVFVVFFFWFLGMVNSINLIDGMDGLAGGAFFLIALAMSYLGWVSAHFQFMIIHLVIAVALLAFLVFNGRPAKFFMGDGGSLFLGFHLSVMPILYFVESSPFSTSYLDLTPFLLVSSYFIIDTLRVFLVRIRRKQNPLTPDNSHLHHLLLHSSLSYNSTLLIIFSFIGISGVFAILQFKYELTGIIMVLYLLLLAAFILVNYLCDTLISRVKRSVQGNRLLLKKIRKIASKDQKQLIHSALFMYFFVSSCFLCFNFIFKTNSDYVFFYLLFCFLMLILILSESIRPAYKVIIMLAFQYILLGLVFEFDQLQMGYYNYVLIKLFLIGLLLWGCASFFVKRSVSFLLRFWSILDLLVFVLFFAMGCLMAFGAPIPFIWSSAWILFELCIGYFVYRIIFQ